MDQANAQVVIGIVLAWSFGWPVIKASKEGPRSLLPVKPETAMTFSVICSLLALAAAPAAFFSKELNGWFVLLALIVAQIIADGPVWRFFYETGRLPVLWIVGAAGCVFLLFGYSALL